MNDAISALNEEVRQHPADRKSRVFLSELLCFAGNLERADKQLEVLQSQFPDAAVNISLLRQMVRGEEARQQFFSEGRAPELLTEPTPAMALHLEASVCLREGNGAEANELLEKAESERVAVSGTCDGVKFDDFRDLDDLVGPFFEVITSTGKYFWIPTERVVEIECYEPTSALDLLWRRVRMVVRDGPDGDVYIPAIYAAGGEVEEAARLGRVTEWTGGDGEPTRGVGLRTFLVGESARTILECSEISFEEAAGE